MPKRKEPTSIAQIIEPVLKNVSEFAYLLGSADTPRFRSDSDVDIAFYPRSKMTDSESSDLRRRLESVLNRDVDLISLVGIDPIFGRQVLETGRLISLRDPGTHLEWKAHQLSIYPDFKYSRAIIEKNLLKRKSYV